MINSLNIMNQVSSEASGAKKGSSEKKVFVLGELLKKSGSDKEKSTKLSDLIKQLKLDLKENKEISKETKEKITDLFGGKIGKKILEILEESGFEKNLVEKLKDISGIADFKNNNDFTEKEIEEIQSLLASLVDEGVISNVKIEISKVNSEDKEKTVEEKNTIIKTQTTKEGDTTESKETTDNVIAVKNNKINSLSKDNHNNKDQKQKEGNTETKEITKEFFTEEGKKVRLEIKMEITKTDSTDVKQEIKEFVVNELTDNNNNVFERVEQNNDFKTESVEKPLTYSSQNIVKTVLKNVNFNVDGLKKEMTFNMDPENLGKVKVVIQREDGQVNIKLMTENSSAKTVLNNNISELRNEIQKQGINISNVEVVVDPDGKNNQEKDTKDQQEENRKKREKMAKIVNFNDFIRAFEVDVTNVNLNL